MTYTGVMERTESPAAAVTTPLHGEVVRRTPVRTHAGIAQRTVYGWGRYYRQVRQLPPDQRRALIEIGEAIKRGFQPGGTDVRAVQIEGHSDYDTPRNLQRERQVSVQRAEAVATWLKTYVGPRIAGRISWTIRGLGATRLRAAPTSESNRRQNRRVEIILLLTRPPAPICAVPAGRNRALTAWTQAVLNRTLQLRLQPSGIMGRDTRSALRHYQLRRRLPPSGLMDAQTVRAFKEDGAGDPPCPLPPSPPRWAAILGPRVSTNTALRAQNAVQWLIDAGDTFRSMVEAIRTAVSREQYVYLLGWKLVDDFQLIPGDRTSLARVLLADASARGAQIRAMLWAKPPLENRDEVTRINRLKTGAAILDDLTPHHVYGAHHQKVLIVKGSQRLIGSCGGLDINSDRIQVVGVSKGEPLHDVHCRVAGPSAWDLLQTFIRRWDHHPDHTGIDRMRGGLLGRREPLPSTIATPSLGTSSTGASCSVVIARTFNPVARRVVMPREHDIRTLLLAAVANAQSFIYMEDQYLISMDMAAALRAAVPRLQHLTILIAASEVISDTPCIWKFRRDFVNTLTAGLSPADLAKVRIFHRITPPSSRPTFGQHTYVHAKVWMIDDELAVIGGANCNRRGCEHDSEVKAFVFDDAIPIGPGGLTFAQGLRMNLWSEHLNTPPAAVVDGVASAGLWLTPPPGARVAPYNPTAGRDPWPQTDEFCDRSRDVIDPGFP